jgi:23S rRNA pseudouridine1911/1915/1917 synthase
MTLNRGFTYRTQIGPEAAGRRVRDHLPAAYAHSNTAAWNARIAAGEVDLDGQVAGGDETLQNGQHLAWHRPPWDEPDVPLTFDLVHEDADVVAVAKPAGLPTMPAGGFLEHTLLTIVRAQWGDVHPLHRLGRFTSGLVLFARNHDAAAVLGQAWRSHAVTKTYRALVDGTVTWDSRDIAVPIGLVPHPTLGTVHAARDDGRTAHSVVGVVERRAGTTLVDVQITTGRPHQIRIHLAAAGHPLTGDPLYAAGGRPHAVAPGLPGDGGYLLHAHRLQLAHPRGLGALQLEAPLPETLRETRANQR